MNDADARQLIERYATSYYHDGPLIPCHPSDLAKAKAEIQQPGALLNGMEQNGREASEALRAVGERRLRAQRDGLFDIDMVKAADKKHQPAWLAAIQTIRGDFDRAKSELAHWREYWTWAKAHPGTKPMDVRALADAKSYEDTRLPAEAR